MNKILVTAFVLWMCIGIFPLQCYETDGWEIILGCDILYREGWTLPPVYSYAYWMQPLMTILIVGVKHLVPLLSCEQIYCLLSAAASLVFVHGCVVLARRITGESTLRVLMATALLPEMYAIAMYPNTAAPAAACFVWALLLISKRRYWLAGLLMCIAALFRIDVMLVFPVILPLMWYEGKPLLKSLGVSACFGVAVVAATFGLYALLGADLLHTLDEYGLKGNLGLTEFALAIVGYYSLVYFVLLPVGLGVITAQRRWRLLGLILLPLVVIHGFTMGSASKHFLYLSPFVITAGVYALAWIEGRLRGRRVLKWAVGAGLLLFMTVSVRKQNLSMPWVQQNPLHQAGMVLPLYTMERGNWAIALGIGAGYQLVTADENMLATGHLFYPWYIREIKEVMGGWREEQMEVARGLTTANLTTCEWGALAPIAIGLMEDGDCHFRQRENMPEAYMYTLSRRQGDLHFWRVISGAVTGQQQIGDSIARLSALLPAGGRFIVAGLNHYGTDHLLDEMAQTGGMEKKAACLYEIRR